MSSPIDMSNVTELAALSGILIVVLRWKIGMLREYSPGGTEFSLQLPRGPLVRIGVEVNLPLGPVKLTW